MSSDLMQVPAAEVLGRAVFDGRRAERARKGIIDPRIFRERDGVQTLSVDMLANADKDKLSSLHDTERDNQKFHGWATIDIKAATEMERTVLAIATEQNEWHAEITLPLSEGKLNVSTDDQKAHSLNLANNAVWEERTAAAPNI